MHTTTEANSKVLYNAMRGGLYGSQQIRVTKVIDKFNSKIGEQLELKYFELQCIGI